MRRREPDLYWPPWMGAVCLGFAMAVVVATPFVHAHGELAPVAILLLVVAIGPWAVDAAFNRHVPHQLFALGVLTPLAVVHVAGTPLGLVEPHGGQLSLMLVVMAVGQLAATTPARAALVYTVAGLAVPFGRLLADPQFEEWVFWAAGVLLAAGVGFVMRRQQRLLTELGAAQAALADEAALAERRRIAREVHDVIAHSLTVSMLHVTAARMAVRRDPGAVQEALEEAERLGRRALQDVRRTVGLLHEGEGGATEVALPTAEDIPDLVEAYAAAGLPVTLECAADLAELTPASGLALYRAVQEGLANAVKHAAGSTVVVTIRRNGKHVTAVVADRGGRAMAASDGPGLGLRGMRERVEALGGSVSAGPEGEGWVTTCAIPISR